MGKTWIKRLCPYAPTHKSRKEYLPIETVQKVEHGCPGDKGTHLETALRAGNAQGCRGEILIRPGFLGGRHQDVGNFGAHQLVHDIVDLAAVAVMGDEQAALADPAAGPQAPVLPKTVYEQVLKLYEAEKGSAAGQEAAQAGSQPSAPQEKAKGKKKIAELGGKLIGFVSAAVTPMIPGLVGGGILKTLLLLITLVWPAFEEMSTYSLLSMVANVPFYFMPVFVAYGAAKKLNATPIFSMVVTAALVYPDFVETIASGAGATMLGFPVMDVTYTSTLLPALLISVCAYYVEKLLVKIIPGIIRPLLLGVGTMSITFALGITVLGPLGDFIGSYLIASRTGTTMKILCTVRFSTLFSRL